MVKLTDEQKAMLEALDKIPDNEIDFSDIPERPIDWSKARIAPFYRPVWKDYILKLDQSALDCLACNLAEGQTLDESVSKALRAQMFRIRFPVRVEKAEKRVRQIQESPEQINDLFEIQKQEIEILYAMPIKEVAASEIPLQSMNWIEPQGRAEIQDTSIMLDENVVDWFEYRLEDGQSLDETINKALMDHINWVSTPRGAPQKESSEKALDSA